jgi:hypothetical protein
LSWRRSQASTSHSQTILPNEFVTLPFVAPHVQLPKERYHQFLKGEYKAPPNMPEHEIGIGFVCGNPLTHVITEREAIEFQKSGEFFRAMAPVMSSRFTRPEGIVITFTGLSSLW